MQGSLDALDAFLNTQVGEFEPEVSEMVAYCLRNRGKRIRPMLVFLWGQQDPQQICPELVQTAAVIELVHLATLVHDDILDDATLRHNTDTISARWGNSMAVLLGDALFSHALKLASDFGTVTVCREVSQATRKVCSGEILQNFPQDRTGPSLDHYYRVIDLKTAELFRVSCLLGAQLGERPVEVVRQAAAFGRQLGLAYQIFDDLMDILGSEDATGKTLGTDMATSKFTLPVLLLLQTAPDKIARGMRGRILEGDLKNGEFVQLMHQYGITAMVRETFDEALQRTRDCLYPLPPSPTRELLAILPDFLQREMTKLTGGKT